MNNELKKVSTTAERLRESMELRGKKQVDLAQATGLYKGALSNYLSGRYEPKQGAIYKLAMVLDVSEMWLAGYDVPMERTIAQKKNDAISGIVHQMLEDEEFLAIVESISKMPPEKRHGLWAFLG